MVRDFHSISNFVYRNNISNYNSSGYNGAASTLLLPQGVRSAIIEITPEPLPAAPSIVAAGQHPPPHPSPNPHCNPLASSSQPYYPATSLPTYSITITGYRGPIPKWMKCLPPHRARLRY